MGWTEARKRRARLFTWLLLGAAAVTLWTLTQVWFAWATPGVPPGCGPVPNGSATISVQTGDGSVIDGVAARGCVKGSELSGKAESGNIPVDAARTSSHSVFTQDAPSNIAGIPRVVVGLAAVGFLGGLAVAIRKGWLGLVSLVLFQFPMQDAATVRAYYMGDAGGLLTAPGPGLEWFTYMLVGVGILALSSTVFVLKVNHAERKALRQEAIARGEEPPAEPLDPILSYVGRKIGTVRDAANESNRKQQVVSHPASAATQGR